MLLINEKGETELSFDAGSAKLASFKSDSCLVVSEVELTENNTERIVTVIKKVESMKDYKIKTDAGKVIELAKAKVLDVIDVFKSVGITSNANEAVISDATVESYKVGDATPNFINIVVYYDTEKSVELKFKRSNEVIKMADILSALAKEDEFKTFASTKVGYEVAGLYTEKDGKKKTISATVKILTDMTVKCIWKKAAADNSSNGDEFTYTKTPGKITKVFAHLYDRSNASDELTEDEISQLHKRGNSYEPSYEQVIDADGVLRFEFGYNMNDGYRNIYNVHKIDSSKDVIVVLDVDDIVDSDYIPTVYSKIISNENCSKLSEVLADKLGINIDSNGLQDRLYNIKSYGVGVISSDLLYSTSWSCVYGFNDNSSYTVSEYYSNCLESESMVYSDSSSYWNGASIIVKAIEEGRALDILINLSDLRNSI